jgi:DNA-binding winged helix-turn-helix (wHTH) protein
VQVNRHYLLGEFELEPEKSLIRREDETVHLAELPFQVLLYLVEHRERYVSRQELLDRFWTGSDGYEETLTKCISTIRTQLNDPPSTPRFIGTRKKVGYRCAAGSLRRNQPDQAIEFLKVSTAHESAALFWPTYLRGQAYLRLGRGTEAAAEFRKILDHRGWEPLSAIYPLAHLGLARASTLAGDMAGSRKEYQDFLALWKDADADLPILIEVKKEYEKLK